MSNNNTNTQIPESLHTKANIHFSMKGEDYGTGVEASFTLHPEDGTQSIKMKMARMGELAQQLGKDVMKILVRNGYKAQKNYEAGPGIAFKFVKKDADYLITAYIGEVGKNFDPKKIMDKKHYKIDVATLDAILTFVANNDKVEAERAEAAKVERSTLDLD